MKNTLLTLFLSLNFAAALFAQINGVVVDEKTGDPIEGVMVRDKSTNEQNMTNKDGQFELPVNYEAGVSRTFVLNKKGYESLEGEKSIRKKGVVPDFQMKKDDRYLWIYIVDGKTGEVIPEAVVSIRNLEKQTNKSGLVFFEIFDRGWENFGIAVIKDCYKKEVIQRTQAKGEITIRLIPTCKDVVAPEEDFTKKIIGTYQIKSKFLNPNMLGIPMDSEHEIVIQKKDNQTITVLDKLKMFLIKIDISYDVKLEKHGDKILFTIPEQKYQTQTIKGIGGKTHQAHGEYNLKTGTINFSYMSSDNAANMPFNISGKR